MQRQLTFGGGVSPRNTRLRGQGAIEYVLVIAIIVLVVMIAGPRVSSAIRNQFNTVAGVLVNGTAGGTWEPSGSGSGNGAGSATVQAALVKDAKDWTLGEQKAVAEDIAAKGEASPAYAKARAAMDAGTKFSMKLTNGKTLEYRIIGINNDDIADGSGKAGLTFEATNSVMGVQRMNATFTNVGGWEESELRSRLNTGDLWSLMPSDFRSKVKSVTKMTDNKGDSKPGTSAGTPSATTDKVFLLSCTEVYGDLASDGSQYEYFKSKGVTKSNHSGARPESIVNYWTRSVFPVFGYPAYPGYFCYVVDYGDWSCGFAESSYTVFPAWCF